ncbi:recombinase family protein [Microbulbifer thermotolerans]|uniref:recombinase family protein n=1 Tax=Microbulbifer thermotolerans TaxID=252514 RepID=UPI00224B34AF|nr:recombinase family protein [Microbulbifer thermotolerans]MCX2833258.1 recombinase family protein [Microbulbifer thermotolerans]
MKNYRECPYCAEKIKRRARICRFCNSEVEPIYVEHPGANKQIIKILDLVEKGKDYESIAHELNEEKVFRIDNGNPWTSNDIRQIAEDFRLEKSDIKNTKTQKTEHSNTHKPSLIKEKRNKNISIICTFTFIFFVFLFANFKNNDSAAKITPPFTERKVCKAGVATMNMVSPKIIKLDGVSGNVYDFSYIRKSDNTKWTSKCKIKGDKIIWSFNGGRWRVHPLDTVVTFKTTTNVVTIYTTESDGSSSFDVYGFSEL